MTHAIYLDYNATAPIRPEVISLVSEVMSEGGNPSSVHALGRKARARVEGARRQLASLVECKAQEIIFTSGGTEANNMVFNGFEGRKLIIGAGEHDSVLASAMQQNAVQVPLNTDGVIDLDALNSLLSTIEEPALISVMMANNETGVIQPISEIVELAREHSALVHTDAIQAVGKIPVSFSNLGVDIMTVSSHKIGGPQGQGALILREGVPISAGQKGGGQELGRRGGTENVAGIAGFGLAAEMAALEIDKISALAELRDHLEAEITQYCPHAVIYGKSALRLPTTSCISMPGVGAELQVMNFDLAGIAVSAGSACSSGKVKASHVLTAMGASDEAASEAIRVSLGLSRRPMRLINLWKSGKSCITRKAPEVRHNADLGVKKRVTEFMSKLTFVKPNGDRVEVVAPIGKTLLEIAHQNGLELEGACEGSLACSTCHLIIDEDDFDRLPEASDDEEDMLDLAWGLTPTSRLGCQIVMTEELEGMVVTLPSGFNNQLF
ncbi:aminotransferase class V-fold PLP-dependent enzyme [Sneathiella glossodoripedis]|uniref:aminotransferase class V-fold PLP-dependent enzyme n=1 Tax=Sneathiella glossodoripedis TaxID=418853 RepID=UPI000A64B236|nr:aminotransferase class V-fold PLP-dependent enzyme [Sneathiella glossodoripedis]